MSRSEVIPSARRLPGLRKLTILVMLGVVGSFGCWEQIDDGKWFPQMKRQRAVQAFERVLYRGQGQGFTPPDGTVPIGGSALPDLASMGLAEQDALANPVPYSLESLKNGEVLFQRYCATCHGVGGLGDGPVAASSPFAPNASGPFPLVLPIAGPMSMARVFSDGHIYTTMSLGRGRMPNYNRIPPAHRWDVVNYIRELNGQGARQ